MKKLKSIPSPPSSPGPILIREGASCFCPKCHSTAVRKPWLFGNRFCISPSCYYHTHPILKWKK